MDPHVCNNSGPAGAEQDMAAWALQHDARLQLIQHALGRMAGLRAWLLCCTFACSTGIGTYLAVP